MSNVPSKLHYTVTHEWARQEVDGTFTVGITDHAQDILGEIVAVDFPPVGREYRAGDPVTVVESAKTASDVYAPVSGFVIAVNTQLTDDTAELNVAPYEHWLFKISPTDVEEIQFLLSAERYSAEIGE